MWILTSSGGRVRGQCEARPSFAFEQLRQSVVRVVAAAAAADGAAAATTGRAPGTVPKRVAVPKWPLAALRMAAAA
jgi:hypothetical protein